MHRKITKPMSKVRRLRIERTICLVLIVLMGLSWPASYAIYR